MKEYPILPLRNTVLFPGQIIPIYIGREQSLKLIDSLSDLEDKTIMVVSQKEGNVEFPKKEDIYHVGTLATVMKVFSMPDNSKSAIVKGIKRVKVTKFLKDSPYFTCYLDEMAEIPCDTEEFKTLSTNLKNLFTKLIEVAPYLSDEQTNVISNVQDPSKFTDKIISLLNIGTKEKQMILEEIDVRKKVEKVLVMVNKEMQKIELGDKIQADVQDEISKSQKEYYLREQMKAIKKELGEDEGTVELKDLEDKIKEAKMPKESEKVATKELDRLSRIPTQSPEYNVSRTYIEWLADLPWSDSTDDRIDLKEALEIMDEDHYGLEKVKERIIEYLAVRNLKQKKDPNGSVRGPILCFGGPPGVGKTSLGKSIARAMGREFVRLSLGGIRDEAEIRGHRRTYIGALPGRMIQSIKKAGKNNPVFMLDEIDKLGSDFRGDPSSALLEVLDPEQNHSFSDHYLEVDFDLSNVMFIATANYQDAIPIALRDRMEILDFSGYIEDEKIQIAKRHLIPKQIEENGLEKNEVTFDLGSIKELISSYTREAGVRNLERQIANVLRKVARRQVENKTKKISITKTKISNYLGAPRFHSELAERVTKPGVVTGLAWTAAGGDILFVESTLMKGKGKLTLTGQLGDVMKESATAGLTYVRSHADDFYIDSGFNETSDIHVHVPAGAIPKDGPSAGVAMISSMVSLLTDKPIENYLGMTGEISLRGNVLPIGGLKEKSTAAHRAGLKHIIAPYLNEKDLEEIPAKVKKDLKITFVKEVEDVIKLALDL